MLAVSAGAGYEVGSPSSATITVSGRNLHTWSNWTSLDPETFWVTNQFDKSNQTFTPQLAQFVTSVRLTF